VGYVTASIAGNTVNNPSGAATYLSATLVQPTEFQGSSESSPSGTKQITFAGGVPTSLDGKYVLEISSGANEGWWTAVESSTANSITVADNFPSSLASNVQISVRKFSTVKNVFGANTPGLNPYDGDVTRADEIQILDPLTGSPQVVVYLPFEISGEPDTWLDFVGGVSADDSIIYPGTSVRVIRFGANDATLVSTGVVKTTKTQVDVFPAENWLGQTLAAGSTLGVMSFSSQIINYDEVALNDYMYILNADQSANTYIALDPALEGGFMLDFVQGLDASSVIVNPGTGYIVTRDASQSSSVLTLPAQIVGN